MFKAYREEEVNIYKKKNFIDIKLKYPLFFFRVSILADKEKL